MPIHAKRDEVSLSFHYLQRQQKNEDAPPTPIALTSHEFDALFAGLDGLRNLDYTDEEIKNRVRYRSLAPIKRAERVNARTIAGVYDGSYWGLEQTNTAVGRIPADSITFLPFFFMLYLSEDGQIYIVSQYIGTFGGYGAIKSTVLDFLFEPKNITAHSINAAGFEIRNARPKKVEIGYTRHGASLASGNSVGQVGAIVFKKANREDSSFEDGVNSTLLADNNTPADVRRAVTQLLEQNSMMAINEDDIESCRVLAVVNGKDKMIHLLSGTTYATRFTVDVPIVDSHPQYEPLLAKALELLEREVISRTANV